MVEVDGRRVSVTEAAELLGISRVNVYCYVHNNGVSHQQAVDYYAAKRQAG